MAINITTVLDRFSAADYKAYVSNYALGDLAYKNYFPGLYQPTLTFQSLEAQVGLKVAADVVAFNSRAPRKGRQMPTVSSGSIPKIEMALPKEESDINRYNQLKDIAARLPGNTQISNQLIEFMYGDAARCLDGVNSKLEWMAKRIASTGKVVLTFANNSGGYQTEVDVDFGIPSANINDAAVDWDTVSTATPIADIRAVQDEARAKGVILRYAFTDQATFNRLAATAEMQKFAASFANVALNNFQRPSLGNVNAALSDAGLPTFIIWDSYVQMETKDGVLTPTTGWEDGRICFSQTPTLGNTQNTTVADETVNDGTIKEKSDFVLVKTWFEQDPLVQVTKGVAYAVPVLNGASSIYILKTQL